MKVLMVSPYPMHPTNQGSRIRIKTLFSAIRELGHDIDYLNVMANTGDKEQDEDFVGKSHYYGVDFGYNKDFSSRIRHILKKFTDRQWLFYLNNKVDDYCSDETVAYVQKLDALNHYDVIWVEYIFLSKVLTVFDKDKIKVLDTHDRFTDRYKQFIQNHKQYRWFSVSAAEEKKALLRADVAIAIQEEEAQYFRGMAGENTSIRSIGHKVTLNPLPLDHQHKILFLASGITLNVDAINWFVGDVFPLIIDKVKDVELILAGSICKQVQFSHPNIKMIGFVDALSDGYAEADIFINPIEYGTGLKIKSVEALGFGRVLVTTSEGASGLKSEHNKNFIIADDARSFAKEIIELMGEKSQLDVIAKNGFQYAEKLNKRVDQEVEKVLKRT